MKPLRKLAAVATTVLLAGGLLTATAAPSLAMTDGVAPQGSAGAFSLRNGLPLVDSQSGYGAGLTGGQERIVPVPGAGSGSALVRLSALDPANDVLISANGQPALSTRSGVSASTTVLVPVTNGAFSVSSSVDVDVRIELVATFSAGDPGAGATVALETPILRADSNGGLGTGSETADPSFGVGVVGLGGVPSTNVRAVYLTLITEAAATAAVNVGGQTIPIQAGSNVVSTLVPVAPDGTVDVRVTQGTASTKVVVRGYVMDAPQNAATLTIDNGFNTVPAGETRTVHVVDGNPVSLDIDAPNDATHAVLSIQATGATATSHLHAGVPYIGRGQGVVVSESGPSDPQMVIAELDAEGRVPLAVRHGSTAAAVTVLGSLAGGAQRAGTGPEIDVTSPASNAHVDLSEVGTFTITGTITGASATLNRVAVTADGQYLGTASVRPSGEGHEFSFQTSVPTGGLHRFTFEATDRLGRSDTAEVAVNVTVPNADSTVITEDVVIQEGADAVDLLAATDDSLTFAADPLVEPGEFIVGSDDEAAPEGYLREVVAVDSTDDGFVVRTAPAALTDVILQADVSEQVGMITSEGASLYPVNTAEPSKIVVATGGEEMAARNIDVDFDSSIGRTISVEAFLGWEGERQSPEESTSKSAHKEKNTSLKTEGGIGLSGEAKLSIALVFELKIVIDTGWFERPKANLENFKVAVEREIESSVELQAHGSFSAEWEKELADWNIGKVTFMIGPLPVYITAEAAIIVAASVEGEVKAAMTWSVKEEQQYGFIYDEEGLRAVSPWPPVSNAPIRMENGYSREEADGELSVEGKLAAQVGPELEFQVSIYDAAGPVITAGALAAAEASFAMGDPIEWEIYIEGQVGVSVRLEVPIIDAVLLEAEIMATKSKKFDLLSGEIPWHEFWKFGPEGPEVPEQPGEDPGDDPVGLDPIPIPELSFPGSSLRATLYWDNQSDLDLSVMQPDGEWIDYQNRGPSSSGGLLDIDAHANCNITDLGFDGGLENVYWQENSAAEPGQYSIRIDEFNRCNYPDHAKWVLKVYVDEELRYQQSGNTEQQFKFNLQNPGTSAQTMGRSADSADIGLIPEEMREMPDLAKPVK